MHETTEKLSPTHLTEGASMPKMAEFAKRRKQLMQEIGPNGILIASSAPVAIRNGDYDFPFRQHSDFYYLTGFDEPNSVLVLAPTRKDGDESRSSLGTGHACPDPLRDRGAVPPRLGVCRTCVRQTP